jgi:dCTP deaminase
MLVDWQIRRLVKGEGVFPIDQFEPLLEPFSEGMSGNGVISYGLTHSGYDLRLSPEGILLFSAHPQTARPHEVDPKRFKDDKYRSEVFTPVTPRHDGGIPIPAGGYILGRSVEYIRMPRNLSGTCVGKSSYARCGILINTTPLEPGWQGYLTIEIGNICSLPAVVYVNEGIAQLRFELLAAMPEQDYAQKGGKYDRQTETTPARVL